MPPSHRPKKFHADFYWRGSSQIGFSTILHSCFFFNKLDQSIYGNSQRTKIISPLFTPQIITKLQTFTCYRIPNYLFEMHKIYCIYRNTAYFITDVNRNDTLKRVLIAFNFAQLFLILFHF